MNKSERIVFLKNKIAEFETLRKTSKNTQQVESIIKAYKEELKSLGLSTLDAWV